MLVVMSFRRDRAGRPWLHNFGLGLVVAGLFACAGTSSRSDEPRQERSLEPYVPLKVGYAWTYAVRFPGQAGRRTVRISEHDDQGYFVDDAGGAFQLTQSGLRDRDRYLIRHPVRVGTTWKAVVSAGAVEHYRIERVGEPCEAQAGRFEDCVVVQSTLRRDASLTLRITFTWARGVGLVKVKTVADVRGRGQIPQTEQSLVSYRFGSKPPDADDGPDTWSR